MTPAIAAIAIAKPAGAGRKKSETTRASQESSGGELVISCD
jgi:hypothetical protein